MGMFDKPRYLTGDSGFVEPGETFYLHNARIEGEVAIGKDVRPQAKLLVSKTEEGPKEVVFTSGSGITGQIKRMDASDRANMPMHVRLDQVPSNHGNPTNVITPADQEPPTREDFAGGSVTDF